jgi:hypothetical protein
VATLVQTVLVCESCGERSTPAPNAPAARRAARGWWQLVPLGTDTEYGETDGRYLHRLPTQSRTVCPRCVSRLDSGEPWVLRTAEEVVR